MAASIFLFLRFSPRNALSVNDFFVVKISVYVDYDNRVVGSFLYKCF